MTNEDLIAEARTRARHQRGDETRDGELVHSQMASLLDDLADALESLSVPSGDTDDQRGLTTRWLERLAKTDEALKGEGR